MQEIISSILEKIMSDVVPVHKEPPTIKASTLEDAGKKMSRAGYEMSEWSINVLADYLKGYNLWLCGKVGVGKTYFFDCINRVRKASDINPIRKLSMIETQGWTIETAKSWAEENEMNDVLIDDVGTEPEEMVSYGQKIELFPYLLEKRMQLDHCRTHLTSNLGAKDISKRYGPRIADRFVQFFKMCQYPDTIGGKKTGSRRKLSPWLRTRGNGLI